MPLLGVGCRRFSTGAGGNGTWTNEPVEIVELAGRLEPVRSTWVSAEMAGRIVSVPATEHASIAQGEVLVELDSALPRAELIRAAGNGQLVGREWESARGTLAQILLVDQFSRACWRGRNEAFAYDARGASLAEEMVEKGWFESELTPVER